GWHALIGDNGAGKSTLLELIRGALTPDEGQVRRRAGVGAPRIVSVPQEASLDHAEVSALATARDGEANRLRAALRLDPAALARASLSPGERRRWLIGAALFARPEVLLLDEPESHLDLAGRRWLVEALMRFGGIGVMVAHDRALLDALCARTIVLDRGALRMCEGGATEALATIARERELAIARRRELGEEVRRRERSERVA